MKFEKKILKLKGQDKEEYFIDPRSKAHIAQVRTDNRIYINNKFEKLPLIDRQTIIYHERGHSKFKLFRLLSHLIAPVFLAICFFTLLLSLFILIVNFKFNLQIFDIPNVIWFIGIIISILFFISAVIIYWLQEIISDSNAVKKIGKKQVVKAIGTFYLNKKFNLWNDLVLHPPWKLRKKIIEGLD